MRGLLAKLKYRFPPVRRGWAAAAACLAVAGGISGAAASPAGASVAASVPTVTALGGGFDTCAAPATSALGAWYNPSPYWWVGIYIGGDERACSQPNLTASWIQTNSQNGWGFEPLWVGPQMSSANGCSSTYFTYAISTSTSTANRQGKVQAAAAVEAARNLGLAAGGVLYYDLEAYSSGTPSCVAAARAFINGWDVKLQNSGWHGGVYGSTCGSSLSSLATIRHVPLDIAGADWDGNTSTTVMACVGANSWSNGHRIKQYQGGHNETWGGVTQNIDSDCAYGAIYDATTPNDTGDGCN
jgi:hypothetical protein